MEKIIHEELGQELENIGFHYVSGERLFWPYEREKDGIKQEIMVVRDRYEKKYIKVIFHTNAYMQKPREFCDFVPEEGAKHWDFWGFDNEEGLREILKEFKRLIFTYGLDFMETISKPATDAVPTEEKQRYLYEHHQELFKKYQEELGTEGKSPEYDLDIVVDVEEKRFMDLSSSKDAEEESFDLEEIYRISEKLYIKEIYAYKNSDVDMVIFQTNTYGLSVSGGEKGFLYLEQDLSKDINEYSIFRPYRTHDYSEIMDHWYYFDIFY